MEELKENIEQLKKSQDRETAKKLNLSREDNLIDYIIELEKSLVEQ